MLVKEFFYRDRQRDYATCSPAQLIDAIKPTRKSHMQAGRAYLTTKAGTEMKMRRRGRMRNDSGAAVEGGN